MPTYMHQWSYKDSLVRTIVEKPEERDRAEAVRTAIEAFGGTMRGFYFCFGEFDGIAISEFDDERAALACIVALVGQGNVVGVRTTMLFPRKDVLESIAATKEVIDGRPVALPPRPR